MVADVVTLDVEAIDLSAPNFFKLGLREALEGRFGSLFARLQKDRLFFFERSLRTVIVVFRIKILVVTKVDVII